MSAWKTHKNCGFDWVKALWAPTGENISKMSLRESVNAACLNHRTASLPSIPPFISSSSLFSFFPCCKIVCLVRLPFLSSALSLSLVCALLVFVLALWLVKFLVSLADISDFQECWRNSKFNLFKWGAFVLKKGHTPSADKTFTFQNQLCRKMHHKCVQLQLSITFSHSGICSCFY